MNIMYKDAGYIKDLMEQRGLVVKRPPCNQEVGGSNPTIIPVGKNENWTLGSSLHKTCPN